MSFRCDVRGSGEQWGGWFGAGLVVVMSDVGCLPSMEGGCGGMGSLGVIALVVRGESKEVRQDGFAA